jgi:hypothetical protein
VVKAEQEVEALTPIIFVKAAEVLDCTERVLLEVLDKEDLVVKLALVRLGILMVVHMEVEAEQMMMISTLILEMAEMELLDSNSAMINELLILFIS